MRVSLIVAVGLHNQLGLRSKLLWSLKEDLKNFKKLTIKHTVLMGRKTFESIGKPLPNRDNIVITKNNKFVCDGCIVYNSVEKGIEYARNNGENELFIIGGGEIYKYCLEHNLIDRIYLTKVDFDGEADTFFVKLDTQKWIVIDSDNYYKNDSNEFNFKIEILDKKY
jgi:dihydrofolate reductase